MHMAKSAIVQESNPAVAFTGQTRCCALLHRVQSQERGFKPTASLIETITINSRSASLAGAFCRTMAHQNLVGVIGVPRRGELPVTLWLDVVRTYVRTYLVGTQ